MKKLITAFFRILLALAAVLFAAGSAVNIYVVKSTEKYIMDDTDIKQTDGILVLGCAVKNNSEPSKMLKDRMDAAVRLYKMGMSEVMLVSGDHRSEDYNEVAVMKSIAVEEGVLPEDVFMDHDGLNTYKSICNAKKYFEGKSVVIVTQKYHLYRALYMARRAGIEAYGYAAEEKNYSGQWYRNIREYMARIKDFAFTLTLTDKY